MFDSSVGSRLKPWFDGNDFPWTLPLAPWSPQRARTVRRVRHVARRAMRRQRITARGWGHLVAQASAWPLLCILKSAVAARRYATRSPTPDRPGPVWLFLHLWWDQFRHNFRIADYVYHCLWRPEQRQRVALFVTDSENMILLATLNQGVDPKDLADKRRFAAFCRAHQLPHIPILLTGCGRLRDPAPARATLPSADLFLKPAETWGGKGGAILDFNSADGSWRLGGGPARRTPDELAACAQQQIGDAPWIVQPRIRNSTDWAGWSLRGLCTVRILTGWAPDQPQPEPLVAFLRMPRGASPVDNLSSGGIAADLDLASGRLGLARNLGYAMILTAVHPDTGAPIAGRVLPGWPALSDLACRAHREFQRLAFIGWDVTLTPDGPVLVEANPFWNPQINTPLGATRYLEILIAHLDRRSASLATGCTA